MPADALVAASRSAVLTVVGSRGRRSLSRAILGSVSRALMQEAERPVAVVHHVTKKHHREHHHEH
jgi:nucleotide-binding universal stress UspA family protein